MPPETYLRIGELSRRTGVSVDLLRAWERRYGLLEPARSDGGFRLYSDADVDRVRRMQGHLEEGLAAAEAARRALRQPAVTTGSGLTARAREELSDALSRFDDAAAHAVLDGLFGSLSVDAVLSEVLLPYLHRLGEAWERGEASVAQEHFASSLVRGRLLGLARGWGTGGSPHALLACPPGEQHDLALIAFGLALRARGWRITYLGQDTPLQAISEHGRSLAPDHIVIALTRADALEAETEELARLATTVPVWLAGAGATAELAERAGALLLGGDPVAEAQRLTASARR